MALKHGDEIALTLKKKAAPVFIFHDCVRPPEDGLQDPAFMAKYNLVRKLGNGACGEVWLAVEKVSGLRFAVKVIQKRRFNSVSVSLPRLQTNSSPAGLDVIFLRFFFFLT